MKYIVGNKDYLMHHGIKGQSWGVQNGPPYPLDPSIIKKNIENTGKSMKKEYTIGQYKPSEIAKRMTLINDDMQNITKRSDEVYKQTNTYVNEVKNKFFNNGIIRKYNGVPEEI